MPSRPPRLTTSPSHSRSRASPRKIHIWEARTRLAPAGTVSIAWCRRPRGSCACRSAVVLVELPPDHHLLAPSNPPVASAAGPPCAAPPDPQSSRGRRRAGTGTVGPLTCGRARSVSRKVTLPLLFWLIKRFIKFRSVLSQSMITNFGAAFVDAKFDC